MMSRATEMAEEIRITDLNHDCVARMLAHLDSLSLASLSGTCRHFAVLVDQSLQHRHLMRYKGFTRYAILDNLLEQRRHAPSQFGNYAYSQWEFTLGSASLGTALNDLDVQRLYLKCMREVGRKWHRVCTELPKLSSTGIWPETHNLINDTALYRSTFAALSNKIRKTKRGQISLTIKEKLLLNERHVKGHTVLFDAVHTKNSELVRQLIEQEGSLVKNVRDRLGRTAVDVAKDSLMREYLKKSIDL